MEWPKRLLWIMIAWLPGCFPPQVVTLTPRLPPSPIKLGAGQEIFVSVFDRRPESNLGYYYAPNAAGVITATEPLDSVLRQSLAQGLLNLGFAVASNQRQAITTLEVELTTFYYMFSSRRSGITAFASARVFRRDMRVFYKQYSSIIMGGLSRFVMAEKLSDALSDVIFQILADLELLNALQSDSLPPPNDVSTPQAESFQNERGIMDGLNIADFAGEPDLSRALQAKRSCKLDWLGGGEIVSTKTRVFFALSNRLPADRAAHLRGAFLSRIRDPAFHAEAIGIRALNVDEVRRIVAEFHKNR